MKMPTVLKAAAGCALMITASSYAGDHGGRHADAHVHGKGQLSLAVDGSMLEMELNMPAYDILGFETISTREQKASLEKALGTLKSSAIWLPTASARCELISSAASPAGHEGDKHGHVNHDHDHDEQASGHMDISAQYTFECAQPKHLKGLETTLFKHFERSEEIHVQGFTTKGQFAGVLTRSHSEVRF